ncbi:hypothetical protein [Winogradskyella undariae]|uniref:hypothetical protein n=1 Tax=Winogradskyella undariae TaxID=1285465 RepID=UPI0015C788CD|nr:hypothetical protein [Winogradskyella undariae]
MSSPKIIFSINTGRSGSTYLASLLKGFKDVQSFHEPYPSMCGKDMKAYQLGDKQVFGVPIKKKITKILSVLEEGLIYFESNHYFIKGFGWEIVNMFPHEQLGVVVLKRNPKKIVDSFFNIGTSILGRGAFRHLVHPFSPMASVPFESNKIWFWFKLSVMRLVFLCYNMPYYLKLQTKKNFNVFVAFQKRYLNWYVNQTVYLEQQFKSKYPNITYLTIDIDNMEDSNIVSHFQSQLGWTSYSKVDVDKNTAEEIIDRIIHNKKKH